MADRRHLNLLKPGDSVRSSEFGEADASRVTLGEGRHRRGATVLILDPELNMCNVLSAALSRAGYDALAVQSGESAIATLHSRSVDAMVLEFRIPDMRGDVTFELAAGIQPHLRYCTLFMTEDISDRARKLIAACKCHFLRKPFDLRDMIEVNRPEFVGELVT
jgi:DNA-binding NtrC family response regulator